MGWLTRQVAGDSPTGPETCVACGSPDVDWVATGVYVCGSCGHEGGAARSRYEALQRVDILRSWPEERLVAHANVRWREALVALEDALSQLSAVGAGALLADAAELSLGSDHDVSDGIYLQAAAAAETAAAALIDVWALHPDLPLLELPFVDADPGDFSQREVVSFGKRVEYVLVDLYTVADIRAARASLQAQRDTLVAWGRSRGLPMGAVDA